MTPSPLHNLPDREILIDLLHNRNATKQQVIHRIRSYSPHQIHAGLNRLVESGHARVRFDYYEITKAGFNVLCPEDR
jgi:predicted transcriptional regulator